MKNSKNDFLTLWQGLSQGKNLFQVFSDFIMAVGISMSQCVFHSDEKEQRYLEIAHRYTEDELKKFGELLAIVVQAFEEDPRQDFLGTIWMESGFGDSKKGQYFTPYEIAEMSARMTLYSAKEQIREQNWLSVSDSACGSGIMLIAAANYLKGVGINYQRDVLFVGQELDPLIAYMGYIQMTLLGLPGYIKIGNSLTEPMTGHPLFPSEKDLITPLFLLEPWSIRRNLCVMKRALDLEQQKLEN